MKTWYEKPMRVFDLTLEDPYGQWLDRWDARSAIEMVRRINANMLNMMIVNEWGQAYFKSSHMPLHPQLNGSDRLAELLDEAGKHDVRVSGMWGPAPNPILYERHNDWAKRDRQGQLFTWGYKHLDPCPFVCHNSPYGNMVLETLDELFGRYPIDAIAFDLLYPVACSCWFCRQKLLTETGLDLAEIESWTETDHRRYKPWPMADGDRFVARVVQMAHRHGRILVGGLDASDVLFSEPHTGGMINLRDKGFDIRKQEARARFLNKPMVICTPYSHLYYVGLAKPPAHMRQEFREIVMWNGSPWPVCWDWEWIRDPRGLEPLGEVFSQAKDLQPYLSDTESLKHVGLLVSEQATTHADAAYRHLDPVKGWYDALMRAHIPVDLILDEELTRPVLSQYKVLILASATCLDDEQVQAVKQFVQAGGGLIATYRSSIDDGQGLFRRGLALHEVFGCEFQAVMDAPWTYIKFNAADPISAGLDLDIPIMHGEMNSLEAHLDPNKENLALRGLTRDAYQQLKVQPHAGSRVLATIMDSVKPLGSYFVKDLAPASPGRDTGYPAIVTNTFGKGRAVYFAGQVDRLFYRIGHPDHERVMLNAVAWAGGPAAMAIAAPTTVETAYYRQPEQQRIIIHLLNHTYDQMFPVPTARQYGQFSGNVFRPVGDVIPVHDIQITLAEGAKVSAARSLTSGKPLAFQRQADGVRIGLDRLAEYEVLLIEQADSK